MRGECLVRTQNAQKAGGSTASREAGYVTGQTLHVNGGMAMP